MVGPLPYLRATTSSNLLYASPEHIETLPVDSRFNVTIKVANFEPFDGWNIYVKTNASIINPIALSISGDIFEVNGTGAPQVELANCLNGSGTSGCSTDPLGGVGVAQSAVSIIGGTVVGSGLLFTITYNVAGAGFSDITIFNDKISNGSKSSVSHSTLSATYGKRPAKPDFNLELIPDLQITLAKTHNVSQTALIAIDSLDNLSGLVSISASSVLTASINPTTIFLPRGGTNSSTITISATNTTTSTQYFVNVTAVIGSISHWEIFSVQVNPIPDFLMSVAPSLLKIHATNSGSSIITLDTESGYSGGVHLKMDVPLVPGLIASLGATDFNISPGNPATTVFAVRTPASAYPFKYLINITASSNQSTHVPLTITVRPPGSDFNFQIGAPGFVVQAGKSLTVTLNATSLDYFRGQLFFLASSFSGIKSVFTRSSVALDYGPDSTAISRIDYGNSSSSQMTITTDPNLSLGNHNINVTALGTTFLGVPVNHSIVITVTVVPAPSTGMILGLQPVAYFGIIGALWVCLLGVAAREIRRPKPKRFLT